MSSIKKLTQYLSFLIALVILLTAHEGIHALLAKCYAEYESIQFKVIGPEVKYKTAVEDREGAHWAVISGISNLFTLAFGYGLLMISHKISRIPNIFFRATIFYLTLLALLMDALNLSLGPFIYGGDAVGIARGLGLNLYLIQVIFFLILLVNREIVVRKLFPIYGVKIGHILFRPLFK